jgi:hypothetical protein
MKNQFVFHCNTLTRWDCGWRNFQIIVRTDKSATGLANLCPLNDGKPSHKMQMSAQLQAPKLSENMALQLL